ncbi:MAG: UDP-2,3-diacylglucosamine diphosphatase [Rhodocyclaceae bacterium]|nr:UDP-2,3-diacylglucosamine diphosphatase [Rhodocyclaceae bacterium]
MRHLEVGTGERLLFISDLHLCESQPRRTQAFVAFLDGEARDCGQLFILGDLFEYWIGDDDDRPLAAAVAAALARLRGRGVVNWFMAGNRDFLLGQHFAGRAGLSLLADPCLLHCGSDRLLLMHGDSLCVDDLPYQAVRAQLRDPAWQRGFLAQPLPERRRLAEQAREQSRQATAGKAEAIMDAAPTAIESAIAAAGCSVLIHGHTHRPARHSHVVAGHEVTRWVLADWHDRAEFLAWQDGSATAHAG